MKSKWLSRLFGAKLPEAQGSPNPKEGRCSSELGHKPKTTTHADAPVCAASSDPQTLPAGLEKTVPTPETGSPAGSPAELEILEDSTRNPTPQLPVSDEDRMAASSAMGALDQANGLKDQGNVESAIESYNQAIATFTRLVIQEGKAAFAADLITACGSTVIVLLSKSDVDRAVAVADLCLPVCEAVAKAQPELQPQIQALVETYYVKGLQSFQAEGRGGRSSRPFFEKIIRIAAPLAARGALAPAQMMTQALTYTAVRLGESGAEKQRREALEFIDRAVELCEKMLEKHLDFGGLLAEARLLRAHCYYSLSQNLKDGDYRQKATREMNEAVAILKDQIARGKKELEPRLAWANQMRRTCSY